MKDRKRRDFLGILLLLVVGLSVGYALLQTTLKTAFGYATNVSRCSESGTGRSSSFSCGVSGLFASAHAIGSVYAGSSSEICNAGSNGDAFCRWS